MPCALPTPVNASEFNKRDGYLIQPDADGNFSFRPNAIGQVYLQINPGCFNSYPDLLEEWYTASGSTPDPSLAQAVTIQAGQTTSGIDFQVSQGGRVTGTITTQTGDPVSGMCVKGSSSNQTWNQVAASSTSQADGSYTIILPPGQTYLKTDKYCSFSPVNLTDEWYAPSASTPDADQAVPVSISAGQAINGIDFQLDQGISISGYVYEKDTNQPVPNAFVVANIQDQNDHIADALTDETGFYQITGLTGGIDYRVQASAAGYLRAFYPEAALWNGAAAVSVADGQTTSDVDIQIIKAELVHQRACQLCGRVAGLPMSGWKPFIRMAGLWASTPMQMAIIPSLSRQEPGRYSPTRDLGRSA